MPSQPRSAAVKRFAANLTRLRKGSGLTREALAERADCAPNFLYMLERGLRAPSFGLLVRLAEALACDPSVLLAPSPAGADRRDEAAALLAQLADRDVDVVLVVARALRR